MMLSFLLSFLAPQRVLMSSIQIFIQSFVLYKLFLILILVTALFKLKNVGISLHVHASIVASMLHRLTSYFSSQVPSGMKFRGGARMWFFSLLGGPTTQISIKI